MTNGRLRDLYEYFGGICGCGTGSGLEADDARRVKTNNEIDDVTKHETNICYRVYLVVIPGRCHVAYCQNAILLCQCLC
jgi:hypothetical protein